MYPDNRHKMPPYKFKTTNQEETREKGETRPPPVPLDDKPPRVKSVLHIAVARGDLAAVERYLRKDGIPVDLIAEDGLSPLHWSIVSKDPGPMINLLLEHHANVNVRSVPEGATPLMHATQRKLLDAVVILLDNGADINAADKSGFTSLHRACEMGSTEIVKILLERGADANVQAEVGHTPLSLAKLRKEHAVVDLLESHQASADERQVESNTITLCQSWTILGLSIITFVAAAISIAHCSFLGSSLTSTRRNLDTYGSIALGDYVGLFGCDDIETDSGAVMHVAQTFGVIAAVLTCLAMILVIVSLVHDFGSDTKNMIWKCIQVFYPCATVSQSLTFLAFASDSCRKLREDFNCTIGPVGVVAVVNVFLLLILMVIALRTPPPIPLTEESERVTILGLSIVIFPLAVVSIARCSFLRQSGDNWENGLGLFGCEDDFSDVFMRLGRAFGVITVVLTGLAIMLVLLLYCHEDSGARTKDMIRRCIRTIYLCALVSQSLTFLALASDACVKVEEYRPEQGPTGCTLSYVGVVAAVNVLLILIVTVITWWPLFSNLHSRRNVQAVLVGLVVLLACIITVPVVITSSNKHESENFCVEGDIEYGDPADFFDFDALAEAADRCGVAPYGQVPDLSYPDCRAIQPGHTNSYWENENFLCRLSQRPCDVRDYTPPPGSTFDDDYYMDLGDEGMLYLQQDSIPTWRDPAKVWAFFADSAGNAKGPSWSSCYRFYSEGRQHVGQCSGSLYYSDYMFESLVCCEPQDDDSRLYIIIDGVLVDSCPKRISRECRQC